MNDDLSTAVTSSSKSKIMQQALGKMEKQIDDFDKQASKGTFDKIKDMLKAATKVITTGGSKEARLEFTAATHVMNGKNVQQMKTSQTKAVTSFALKVQKEQTAKINNPEKNGGRGGR